MLALKNLHDPIVCNDFCLDENGRFYLVTGPNHGGKSIFCYAVGMAQALFQLGLPVPAEEAEMSPVTGIYTHFPTSDEDNYGKGRLESEMCIRDRLFQGPLDKLRRHSRGNILLEVLNPGPARRVLGAARISACDGGDPNCLQLPALPETSVAELVLSLIHISQRQPGCIMGIGMVHLTVAGTAAVGPMGKQMQFILHMARLQSPDQQKGVLHRNHIVLHGMPEEKGRHSWLHLLFQAEKFPEGPVIPGQVCNRTFVGKIPGRDDRLPQNHRIGAQQRSLCPQICTDFGTMGQQRHRGGQMPARREPAHSQTVGVQIERGGIPAQMQDSTGRIPVSYTHLDVYKRQVRRCGDRGYCSIG